MKFNISSKILIGIFLVLNLIVIGFIVFLFVKAQSYKISDVPVRYKSYLLPFLDKKNNLNIYSKAFVIYDPETRTTILGKNENLRFAPASTAKIMSAVVSLENFQLDEILTATNINVVEGSKMNLEEGESIDVESLLYGMMLPSGNDAAYVLSQNYKGLEGIGRESFINAMNKKAIELKLNNTKFFDPAGFEDDNFTTANDLARLGAYAMKNEKFREIVGTKQKIVTNTDGKIVHNLKNLNELLGIDGVNGIKTGFTNEAGGVLVSSVDVDGKNYIVVVLNTPDRFQDTKTIIEDAVKNIKLIAYWPLSKETYAKKSLPLKIATGRKYCCISFPM